ncbi:1,2-dihydroxy-3-keto-5-methylthiopentene dioxygenase [Tilletia horrida]|nr:1,2-dihydroxy-3-keto-5-methylthiopentene dioxygenase [Tilletia horrida]
MSLSFHQFQQQQQQGSVPMNNGNNNNIIHNGMGGPDGGNGGGMGGPMGGQQGFGPGSAAGTNTAGSGGPNGGAPAAPEYTLAGILHYLQSEWRRYERDRNEWEIERAEMRARIALLEGERRGAENLKTDLMRRVKMLEFALRQERSKYLAQSNTASPGTTAGSGSIPPGVLAKHPLVQGVSGDKASSSGRSSPVARSEDFGKDGTGTPGGPSSTFQTHAIRGPSNLSTNSFTASSLTFSGTFNSPGQAGSTLLSNPATTAGNGSSGPGSSMSFNPAANNAPNASMLSRHTSLARDGKSRAKSRDYLKQCLSEIAYLTNPATLNPLNERAYITGTVPAFPPGPPPQLPSGQQQAQQPGNGQSAAPGAAPIPTALGLATMGAHTAAPGSVIRPRKVMYEDDGKPVVNETGNGSGAPSSQTAPPLPPPPPSLASQALPLTQQQPNGNSAAAPQSSQDSAAASGFIAQGIGLDRPATSSGLTGSGSNASNDPSISGAVAADPLGATIAMEQVSNQVAKAQPDIQVSKPVEDQNAPAEPLVEDAAELLPAPSPSGTEAVVPDVPPPGGDPADGAPSMGSPSSASSSSVGSEDADHSSSSSSTTLEGDEGISAGQKGDVPAAEKQQDLVSTSSTDSAKQPFFEQRSGVAASKPDRSSSDEVGSSHSLAADEGEEVEGEIEDEEEDPVEEHRTAIYRPGGVPPTSNAPTQARSDGSPLEGPTGGGSMAEATAEDWRRLREAGAQGRQRRERERQLAAQGSYGDAAAASALADARAHLAETTESVNALLSQSSYGSGAGSGSIRPGLLRTGSGGGRADEQELANLKLDPVPDLNDDASSSGSGGNARNRRSRTGGIATSALSAATTGEAVADTQPWKAKRVLRGHLDAVRTVAFDTIEPNVLSAGDDCTIKYWRFDPAALQGAGGHAAGAGGGNAGLSRESSISSLRSTASAGGAAATSAADYPIVTFRGHTEPVTSLTVSPPLRNVVGELTSQRRIYSGSLDSSIRVWSAPDPTNGSTEAYPPVEHTVELGSLVGHTDAVWDLALFAHLGSLVSVAADGMVKIWNVDVPIPVNKHASSGDITDEDDQEENDERSGPGAVDAKSPAAVGSLILSFDYYGLDAEESEATEAERAAFLKQAQDSTSDTRNGGLPIPTSVDICHSNIRLCAVAYTNGVVKLFDVVTGKETLKLQSQESKDGSEVSQVNCVVTHPTLPILFTGHEDGNIKMFDLNTGTCSMSMVGHLDAVTTLDIDPAGLTLASGGHDCSVRFWDIMGGGSGSSSSLTGEGSDEDRTAAATAAAAVSVRDACVQEITSHRKKAEEGVLGVKYHSSAPFFASAGADGLVRLFG